MKKFNTLRLDLAEKTLTPAEKKKREEIAMAMERENPGMDTGKKMAIATAAAKRVAEENLDELKSSTLDSYITKVATGPSRGNKNIKAIGGVTTAIRKKAENDNPPFDPDPPKKNPSAVAGKYGIGPSIAAHLAKKGMNLQMKDEIEEGIKSKIAGVALSALAAHGAAHGRVTPDGQGGFTGGFKASPTVTAPASAPAAEAPKGFSREYLQGVVDGKHPRPLLSKEKAAEHLKNMKEAAEQIDEEIKTTHEDPLVVVKDAEGNILTHANSSVAGDIHGITVSHHTIHTGMPVEVVDRDGKKLTVQKSMHHDSEVAKDSASAVKEAKEKTEYDYEGDMARSQLQSIVMNAQKVHDMLKDNDNLPEWVQSKITLAEDYILTVSNYMATEIDEETNKEYTHKVVHNKTGNIVGKYTSLKAATRAADKKDNAYGGYAHQVRRIDEKTIEEASYTIEPATHTPTVKNSKGHSFEGNTYNAKGLKGASIYKNKDTGKYYANKIDANTTFHSSAKEAADKYHTKAK